MIDFIKEKLRILLEVTKITHTQSNQSSRKLNINVDSSNLKQFDIDREEARNRVIELSAQAVSKVRPQDKRNVSNTVKKYFNDATQGDGVYLAILSKNGRFKITTPNRHFDDNEIGGLITGGIYNNLMVPIKAFSGNDEFIRHGRGTVTGKPYGQSGADDARLKVYTIFGDTIRDKVKSNAETKDKYVELNNTFKGNDDKQIARTAFIQNREKERNLNNQKKGPTTLAPDDEEEVLRKQAELQAKYKALKMKGRI